MDIIRPIKLTNFFFFINILKARTYLCNDGVSFVNFAGIFDVAPNKLKTADSFVDIGGHEHIKPWLHVKRVRSLNPKYQILLLRASSFVNHPPMPQRFQINLQYLISIRHYVLLQYSCMKKRKVYLLTHCKYGGTSSITHDSLLPNV